MKYAIEIGCGGMPQDIDETRSGRTFGPFSSEQAAVNTLRKKGWYKPYAAEDVWHQLSGVPGDRREARIVPLIRRKMEGARSLPGI